MSYLLVFEFPSAGPFGAEAARAYADLAADIGSEEGLVWKVWTEDASTRIAGGVYLFAAKEDAERYVAHHSARLQGHGITDIEVRGYGVNEALSRVTHAAVPEPVDASA